MNKKMPRPNFNAAGESLLGPPPINTDGIGRRSLWPLAPVGEAARRDPRIPDPVPNAGPPRSQADASPPVGTVTYQGRKIGADGGVALTGEHAYLVYVKRLGNMVTRALARNYLSGVVESRWRVGGVSLPPDYGYGMGYHGDAAALWPNNPQTYLRNPGIKPIVGVPQTYRYAPMGGIQAVGPLIGDIGNPQAPGTP